MSKYLKRKKGNIFLRIICAILAVILLLVLAAGAFVWKKLDLISYEDGSQVVDYEVPHEIPEEEAYSVNVDGMEISETVPTAPEGEPTTSKDVVNFLLIGTDFKVGNNHYGCRADSMIIVSFNKVNKTVRLVSLERGIGVPILEGEEAGQYDLLTHIFFWGGSELLTKTVEHCFKVDIDYYVRLDFNAVTTIVDAIGGVDIELTQPEAWYLGKFTHLYTSTGTQGPLRTGVCHMDGGTTLAYARLREIDSDWYRVERQRKVILAVVEKLKGSTISELNNLVDTALPLIQTNMTKLDIAGLMLHALDFLTSEFDQMTIPKKGTYGGILIRNGGHGFGVDYEINNDLLYRFLYEGATSEELLAE